MSKEELTPKRTKVLGGGKAEVWRSGKGRKRAVSAARGGDNNTQLKANGK